MCVLMSVSCILGFLFIPDMIGKPLKDYAMDDSCSSSMRAAGNLQDEDEEAFKDEDESIVDSIHY